MTQQPGEPPSGQPDQSGGPFQSPQAGASDQRQEDAGINFQSPQESAGEQAAFTVGQDALAGIPTELRDARQALEDAIRSQGRPAGGQSVEALTSGVGNVQGVAIGLGEPGGPGVPGEPTLNVYVAEKQTSEQVRAVVVDGLGVQAAGDLPLTVRKSGIIDAQSHRFRIRPSPCGVSIAHFRVTAGTQGVLAVGRSAPRNSRLLLVSNNHVIANSNNAAYGDCICQPGPYDGGSCPNDQIAILERFVPIQFGGATNYVDCATGWCWPDRVRREFIYLSGGNANYYRCASSPLMPQLGWYVLKSGRTTQLTGGRIVSLGWSGWINYGGGSNAWFAGQFVVQGTSGDFSAGGDSGSCVVTWDSTRYPTGLLFAGGGGYTICNPMPWVVSALDINLYT